MRQGVLRMSLGIDDGELIVSSINDSFPRRILTVKRRAQADVIIELSPADAKVLARALEVEP